MKLVLLVEDEYGSAEIVRLLLEAAGYRVTIASNGMGALELLDGEKPSMILSDFMMPTMTGADLGVAIRANAGLAEIPFVFISGTSEDVVRQNFDDYDAFVAKPFDVAKLLPLIARLTSDGRSPPADSE